MGLFYLIALGVPGFGAVSASLLGDYGGSFTLTLVNYRALLHQAGQLGPLERSLVYATIVSFITVLGGFVAAWLLSQRRTRTRSTTALDFLLLAAIALPSVVFAAGYIFAYNLPFWSRIGVNLYQTALLLVIAYAAVQPADQCPGAGRRGVPAAALAAGRGPHARRRRADGLGPRRAAGGVPADRDGLAAHVLRRCSSSCRSHSCSTRPASPPASIAIEDNLSNYHFGVGMAQAVLAVGIALAAVLRRTRRLPAARAGRLAQDRRSHPWLSSISIEAVSKVVPGR